MAIPFLKGIDVTGTVDLSNLTVDGAQGTDGQVLTSTGSGIAWEDASGGASLSGGAANKLAIWNSATTLTNDTNLHWNTTNDQLGIGNANPQAKLDITQSQSSQGIIIRSSSVQPEITFIDGATGDSFAIGHNRSGSRMDIEINGTDTHTFKQNGNVGFGTTNPTKPLVVNEVRTGSTASDAYTAVVKSSQSSGASPNPGTGGLKVQYTSSSSNVHAFGLVAGSSSSDFLTTGPMHFYTNSDLDTVSATGYAMQLDTSQRLTIGSMTASQKLNVAGNVTANRYYGNSSTVYYVDPNDSTTAAVLAGGLEIGYGSAGEYRIEVGEGRTGNGYAYIDFVGDTTYSDYGLRLIRNNSGANTSSQLVHRGTGNLEFKTWDAGAMLFSTTNSERMRITSAGNVGIGTTSPGHKLDVSGTGQASNDFRAPIFYDSNNTGYYLDPASLSVINDLDLKENGIQRWYRSGGNARQRADARLDGTNAARLHWYGKTDSNTNTGFKHAWYDGAQYVNVTAQSDFVYFDRVSGTVSVQSDGSFRAPIFYDSNDTNYYTNPNSRSNLSTLVVGSTAANSSSYGIDFYGHLHMHDKEINYVSQLHFNDGVRFVGMDNNSYLKFKWNNTGSGGIRFYDGDDTHHGYIYGDGAGRFGLLDNDGNWAVRIQTGTNPLELSCDNNTEFRVYNSYVEALGSSRAPIFYDSNDTNYYLNPASTSIVNELFVNGKLGFRDSVSSDDGRGIYFEGNSFSTAYAIFRESGSWSNPYPDLRIAFHTGIKLGANSGYNGIRFYTDYDMATQVMSVNNGSDGLGASNVYVNNSLVAGSSLRAPIFYDSNDTNYKVDPNGTSNLNHLNVAGTFRFQRSSWNQTSQDDNVTVTVGDSDITFRHNNDDDGDASVYNFQYRSGGNDVNILNFASNYANFTTPYVRCTNNSTDYAQLESNSSGGVIKAVSNGNTNVLIRSYGESYTLNNFGIGTSSPGGRLHVSSGTSGDAVLIIEADTDNNNENDNPRIELKQDGGAILSLFGINGDAGNTFTNAGTNYAYWRSSDGIDIVTGGNNRAITINNTQKTYFYNDVQVNGASGVLGAVLDLQSNHASYNDSRITFSSADGAPDGTIIYKNEPFKTRFEFYTQTSGTTGTISLSVDQSSAYFANKVYAKEFRDRDNTSYYLHPASSSKLYQLSMFGHSINSGQVMLVPDKTSYSSGGGFTNMTYRKLNSSLSYTPETVVSFQWNTTQKGSIGMNAYGTQFNTSGSDERLKENFETWDENVLNSFETIQPKKFNFKSEPENSQKTKGYIAQEMVDKFPEAYPLMANEDGEDRYMFNPSGMTVYLMKAVKELIEENKQLKQRVEVLENQ